MTGGFFAKAEVGGGETLSRLTGCAACGLNKHCNTPKIEPRGEGKKSILIISECPCSAEDKGGRLFLGDASSYLEKQLKRLKIDVTHDCRKIPAVSCRTPKGRAPTSNEIVQCRPRVLKEIREFKPELIILLGNAAIESVIGSVWKKDLGGITKWRGFTIPDQQYKAWICPIFHPSYVLKAEKEPAIELIWKQDLKRAIQCLHHPRPFRSNDVMQVQVINSTKELVKRIDAVCDWDGLIAIDFETTGLKPDAPNQKLISCSITAINTGTFSFDWPESGPGLTRIQRLFADPSIKKIAQNMKFEDRWARQFKAPISGWEWDTMLASHMLDNRTSVTGLKFQTYVNFGIGDYDSSVEPYLKSREDGAYAVNTIEQAPRQERLIYNGLDTIYTYELALKQMKLFGREVLL